MGLLLGGRRKTADRPEPSDHVSVFHFLPARTATKDNESLLNSLSLMKRSRLNSLLGHQKGAPASAGDLGQRAEEEAATLSRLHLDKRFSAEQSLLAPRERVTAFSRVAAASQARIIYTDVDLFTVGIKTWAHLRIGATDG